MKIEQIFGAPYSPYMQGVVEAFNKTQKLGHRLTSQIEHQRLLLRKDSTHS